MKQVVYQGDRLGGTRRLSTEPLDERGLAAWNRLVATMVRDLDGLPESHPVPLSAAARDRVGELLEGYEALQTPAAKCRSRSGVREDDRRGYEPSEQHVRIGARADAVHLGRGCRGGRVRHDRGRCHVCVRHRSVASLRMDADPSRGARGRDLASTSPSRLASRCA